MPHFSVNDSFAGKLLSWYAVHKRDLPWRNSRDPYKIWLSEIILQQTRVAQGLPYYQKFIQKFPTVTSLASADEEYVLRTWQGLGYYSRARNLHRCAKIISDTMHGNFPESYKDLLKLPGVGPYTAAAIASFSFNQPHAVVDGNVYRVLSRIFGIKKDIATGKGQKYFATIANDLIPETEPGTYNQAIMEFGALHCTPTGPSCHSCPFLGECYAQSHAVQDSLPVKSKKKPSRHRHFNYAVLRLNGQICMRPRTEKDIWQGLYDFPLIETSSALEEEEALQTINTTLSLNNSFHVDSVSSLYKHVLSHQKLFARFYLIDLEHASNVFQSPEMRLFTPGEIHDLPKPVLISRYLNDYIF